MKGALEEYETILRTRKTQRPPIIERAEDPDYQRWFGAAIARVAAAEALLRRGHRALGRALPRVGRATGASSRARTSCALNVVAREAHDARLDDDARGPLPHRGHERGALRRAHGADLPRRRDGLGPLRQRDPRLGVARARARASRPRAGRRAQARPGAPVSFEELFDRARADPLAAWESTAIAPGSPDLEIDPAASVALAVVLAGAAARAVELCAGDPQDADFQRRFGAVSAHASAAEMLARRDAGGLAGGRDRPRVDALLVERDRARDAHLALRRARRDRAGRVAPALRPRASRRRAPGPGARARAAQRLTA